MTIFDRIFVIISCNSKPESQGDISHYRASLKLDYAVRQIDRDDSRGKNEFDRLGELEIGKLESMINSNEKKKMRNSSKNEGVADRIMLIALR